jgi:hypothetical protein
MPEITIAAPQSVLKIHKHETNRKITAIDLNTLSGVNMPGSQLEILLKFFQAFTGKWTGDIVLGLNAPFIQTNKIVTSQALIFTSSGAYYLEDLLLTPTPEAHWGHYELELLTADSDSLSLDFFNPITKTFANKPSSTRRSYTVKIWEVYSTSPVSQSTTAGRIRWIEYQKAASNNPDITLLSQIIDPDWNMDAIQDKIADRYTKAEVDAFFKAESAGKKQIDWSNVTGVIEFGDTGDINYKRVGNYLYWKLVSDADIAGNWRPFA